MLILVSIEILDADLLLLKLDKILDGGRSESRSIAMGLSFPPYFLYLSSSAFKRVFSLKITNVQLPFHLLHFFQLCLGHF